MAEDRPLKEYVAHVRDNHADNRGLAWCGAKASGGWLFQSVDHAAMHGRRGGRILPCPKCREAIIASMVQIEDGTQYEINA